MPVERSKGKTEEHKEAAVDGICQFFKEQGYTKTDIDDVLHRVKASLEKIYGQRFS